jgi:mannan endo-1,4-beta-mannosidase
MQHFGLLLAALLCLACGVADSSAHTLTSRLPAEGTPQARKTAEQAPAAAIRKQDWGVAAAAWETRIARSSDQGFTVAGGTSVPPPSPPVPPVVTPPATGTPRAQLLAYLQSISGTHALIGQTTYSDNNAFNADTQAFGFCPAIMFNDPWLRQWAGNAPYDASFMPAALAHAKAGGIVGMSLLFPNPVDGGPSTDGPAVDPVQLLTPGSALNGSLNRKLDQAAGLLQQFKDAGVAVLTRFMFELDGGWFWWGSTTAGGNFTPAQQTQLYQYIVNYLRVTKGLDNLLTTFAINGGPGTYQYPGDAYVDVVGIDAYTDTLAGTYKNIYGKLISQAPTKLFALTEFGSGNPSAPDRSYDLNRLTSDIRATLPRTVYANFWQNWGPNLQANGKAAMSDPFWINKSQVLLPAPAADTPSRSDTDHLRQRPRQLSPPGQ